MYFLLCATVSYIMFIRASSQDLEGSNWLNMLKSNDPHLSTKYDFMYSLAFFEKTEETSCFSPICFDLNIHLQSLNGELKEDVRDISKTIFEDLIQKISPAEKTEVKTTEDISNAEITGKEQSLRKKQFIVANSLYYKKLRENQEEGPNNYFEKVKFDSSNVETVFEQYKNWVLEKTKRKISTSYDITSFSEKNRIYTSIVYFYDEWEFCFYPISSFKPSSDHFKDRTFMTRKAFYHSDKFQSNGIDFDIVVVPYKKKETSDLPKYMVYLIPENDDTPLKDLWLAFSKKSNNNIAKLIGNLPLKGLNLFIPKIEGLKSKFNMLTILPDLFANHSAEKVQSEMQTYIVINEKGTEAAAVSSSDSVDSPSKKLCADKPHIAFIYDTSIHRILFIIKDNGVIKKNV